ncbi:GAF domain-containing protein [Paenibacillus oenotherae]|uniref:GAF domain-containing protein n=1 Tax=Paenibacillus oenotherae TaxID=1435645 RepID=A0ABS7D7U6_9BACL|nr:GAF domain-containing protein [Paenibacillus oenotherae]MBW7475238.1 GAF domain-containing protein [Paenibacillus oenotherae]
MPLLHSIISQRLESLCRTTSSDFSALAIVEPDGRHVRWRYAYGNRTDRYKQMMLKPGLGPAGVALRTGRPAAWEDRITSSADKSPVIPMMIAEQLRCAFAYPITNRNMICAVLLIARRLPLPYTGSESTHIEDTLPDLLPLLQE